MIKRKVKNIDHAVQIKKWICWSRLFKMEGREELRTLSTNNSEAYKLSLHVEVNEKVKPCMLSLV